MFLDIVIRFHRKVSHRFTNPKLIFNFCLVLCMRSLNMLKRKLNILITMLRIPIQRIVMFFFVAIVCSLFGHVNIRYFLKFEFLDDTKIASKCLHSLL